MGDIKRNFQRIEDKQFLDLLKKEPNGTNKRFKLKGPSSFLFSNLAVLALASCGGGGGGGSESPPAPTPNTNNAPDMGSNATFSFTEDTANSFSIGAPTDADAGDTLTITVDSIPSGGVLTLADGTILSSGSTLTVAQLNDITFSPNANVNTSADSIGSLTLSVTDGQGGSDSATFTFEVTAVDDSPTAISLSDLSITENILGDEVGTISVTDVDSSTFTFSLSGKDAALFEISTDGVLKLKDTVSSDYEAKSSYQVTLTATDSSGNLFSKEFTITALDANDAPTAIQISNLYLSENISGAEIGILSTTDIDLSSEATYTLSGEDEGLFVIDGSSLKLKETVFADYETKSTYSITVTSTDEGGSTKSENFTITVLDNSAPTAVSLSSSLFAENSTGLEIGELSAQDADAGEIISYTLSGADADSFVVSGSTLKLVASISADYETKSSYSITVTATDSDSNSFSKDFTLTVKDIIESETVSGTVVDGYVSGASVKLLDAEGNIIATTTTDSLGQFTLNSESDQGVRIVVDGGVDTSTGEPVTVTLSASKGSSYVSALTTIIDQAGEDAAVVLDNLGLPSDFDLATSNPLETLEAQQINAALINIMAVGESLLEGAGLADGEGDELIVAQIVEALKTSTDIASTSAIKSIIDLSADTLTETAKVRVLELTVTTSESLSNINKEIVDATSISQIAVYQKSVLDDTDSLLTQVASAAASTTAVIEVITQEVAQASAKEAALDLGLNVSPFITIDSLINVKENILSGDGFSTVSASDPEGEKVTFSISGDDSGLFNISADGKISFISSPNFSQPLDRDGNNGYKIDVTATDASGNASVKSIEVKVLDVKGQGQAIDGYLVGATVWADLDADGVIDSDEPTTTTDQQGNFGLDVDLPEGTVLYVTGGYDLGTGKPNEQVFKLTVSEAGSSGASDLVISPVSTQISRAYATGTVTLDEAQNKIAQAYGLSEAFPDLTSFDPIALAYSANSQEQAEAALTAQARNVMVSTLGDTSKKVAEYFTSEIAPVVRTQITDLFKVGTEVLGYSTWDSQVDLRSQPRITIELEGFEDLLAQASETFNDKIVEAILSSTDLDKLFEMKKDGTGQFDLVIKEATDAIILEIKNTVLEEMGFDPATGYTSFVSLENYTGETVTFLGSTKTMGEWAVLISDVLDSEQPSPFDNKVNFGPDGGVTDWAGKYFVEQISKVARHLEVISGKKLSELTDSQIDDLVDMGMEYNRGTTYSDSNSRWVPFDEYGQQLWEQTVWFKYNGERFKYDSNGNRIEGNTGSWMLTPDQIKEYLKNPSVQLKDGNWGNELTTYNWTSTKGDLGIYLALSKARSEDEVVTYMDALTPTDDSIELFSNVIEGFFTQGKVVFQNLVSGALDFTLDKFEDFIEKTFEMERDEVYLNSNSKGLPVSTAVEKTIDGKTYELKTTSGIEWLVRSGGDMNFGVNEEGDFSYSIVGGPDAARFRIDENGSITFKDNAPGELVRKVGTSVETQTELSTDGFQLGKGWGTSTDYQTNAQGELVAHESAMRLLSVPKAANGNRLAVEDETMLTYFDAFNINNLDAVFSGTGGQSPTFSYTLSGIPAAGETGTAVLNISLINERYWDGVDRNNADSTFYQNSFRTATKETLETTITFNWSSDGENVTVSYPDQSMSLKYTNGSGVDETISFTSPNVNGISFSSTEEGLRSLDLNLASLMLGDYPEGVSPSANITNFIKLGAYTFEATFESGILIDDSWAEGEVSFALENITKFVSMFDVTSDTVVMSAENQSASEGDGEARILVTLSKPMDRDFTTDWQVTAGDQFGAYNPATVNEDYVPVSGQITFRAGETEAYITVPIIFDGTQEPTEAFTLTFPRFYSFRDKDSDGTSYNYYDGTTQDGKQLADLVQVSSFDGVSLSHGLNGTTILILDTTVATKDNVGILDDADQDGQYLVTVRVQEGDDFQDFDVVLKFPDWNDQPRPLADSYSFLNPDQKVIEMNEHSSLFTQYNVFKAVDGATPTNPLWSLADGISTNGLKLATDSVKITDWITVDETSQDQSSFVSRTMGIRAKTPSLSKTKIVDESNQTQTQTQELPAIPNPSDSLTGSSSVTPTPTPAPTPTPTPTPTDAGTVTPTPTPTDAGTVTPTPTPTDSSQNLSYGPMTYEVLVNSSNSDGSVSIEYSDAWIIILDNWGLFDYTEGANSYVGPALQALAELIASNSGGWPLPSEPISSGSQLDTPEFWIAYDEALVNFGFTGYSTSSVQDVMDRVWVELDLTDYRTGFTIVADPVPTNSIDYDAGPFNALVLQYTTLSDTGEIQITEEQGLQLWAQTILGGGQGPEGNQMEEVPADYFAVWLTQVTGVAVPLPSSSNSYGELNTPEFYQALGIVIAGSPTFSPEFYSAMQIWFDNVPNPDVVQGWELKTDGVDSLFDWLIKYPVNEAKFDLELQDPTPYFTSDNSTPSDQTIVVTVAGDAPGQYYLDGVLFADYQFTVGATYTFDLSDSSNSNHPFRFSETINGTFGGGSEYTTGVSYSGTAGQAGASTTITVTESTPQLYYYCAVHSGMGGQGTLTAELSGQDFVQVTSLPDDGLILKADGTAISVGDQLTAAEITGLTYTPTNALIENSVGDVFSYSVGSDSVTVSLNQGSSGVSETTLFSYYNPVHVTNLDSLFTDGTGTSPTYSFLLNGIPAAGDSGSATVTSTFFNGRDWSGANQLNTNFYGSDSQNPTRKIETTLSFDWSSDGASITFTIPDQQVVGTVTNSDGSTEVITWDNVDNTFISLNVDEDGQPSLDLKITSLILGQGQGSGADLSDFIQEGRYALEVDFEGLSWADTVNDSVGSYSNFATMIDVTSNKTTVWSQDAVVIEGDTATFTINISQALAEDFVIDYRIEQGTSKYYYAFEGQDYEYTEGSAVIPAGSTSIEVSVNTFVDSENEGAEAFRITFPGFQGQDGDGVSVATNNGFNLAHDYNATEGIILNQEVESTEYLGYKLDITNAPKAGQGRVEIRDRDDNNNSVKDNESFYVQEINGEYYLKVHGGTLDFDDPQDSDQDNVYEITLSIIHYSQGNADSIVTNEELLIVVKDGPDPDLTWQDSGSTRFVQEHNAPVASLQNVQAGDKTLEAYFSVGYSLPIRVNTNDTQLDNSGTPESILRWNYQSSSDSIVYTITGGADQDMFNILNGEVYFTARPSFSNPADADGDNVYEVQITATAGGSSIVKDWEIQVGESSSEQLSKIANPPSELAVYSIKEKPELIGDSQAPRNIVGTDGNDLIKVDPHQFQYVHGGFGDDTLDPGRDWGSHGYLTGGEGADVFLFRSNYMQNSGNFGIRDYADPYDPNAKEGINGYDQNRDGVLDLASELDWTNVVLISDFTPGVDKIALTVSGDSGFNRKDLTSENISFVQGEGDLADHTLILVTETGRGFDNDLGILGVLLNTQATDLDVSRDVDSVGAAYEAILGQINLGAETVKINDSEGNPVSVQQLPNGQYLWFEADYNVKDNSALHQIFTVSTDGIIYAGRPSELDFENPRDADKDNYYEFVFTARLFDTLVLEPNSWGYNVLWDQSQYNGQLTISSILNVKDDINDNLGKVSIAEANYLDANGDINPEMIELVLRQISAVQSSVQDLDFRSIAEEINFDFARFTGASAEDLAQDWFAEDMARRFEDFSREMEETFERNLLNKYNNFTDASLLGNVVGDSGDNQIYGIEANETIFGKAGNDTIAGGAGDDVIFGDAGSDILSGGEGSDRLDGGSGSDRLIADSGSDVLDGGSGDDIIDFSNLTELPEFATGGSGEDTLILAGLPTRIGSTDLTHDNANYTGLDLKKIVSAKETWTSTNSDGTSQTEEGWSNRIESIEKIDLRDSQSLLNVRNVEEDYNGFRISENYFSVTDFIDGEPNTYKSAVIPYTPRFMDLVFYGDRDTENPLALSTRSVLNLTNLQNLFTPDSGTGKAPIFSFALDSIPSAGEQGTTIVTLTLKDGTPPWSSGPSPYITSTLTEEQTKLLNDNAATKTLTAKVKINWTSDGTTVDIKLPPQTVEVTYETSDGLVVEAEFQNTVQDVISVSTGENGTPSLDLKLTSLFSQNNSSMDLSGFFSESVIEEGSYKYANWYNFTVDFEGIEIQAAASQDSKSAQPFSALQAVFKVSDSTLPVIYGENVSVNESDGTATITVKLSSASDADTSIYWQVTPWEYGFLTDDQTLTYADPVTPEDFGTTGSFPSGNLVIPAGETSATFTVNINNDDLSEGTEHSLVYIQGTDAVSGDRLENGSRYPQLTIENSDTFNDVLNISLDTLWRMSWDNRTWTVRGDDTDTVRLVGYESNWTQSDGTLYEYFEPFRKNGTQTIDGVSYDIYDLWDARVLIEEGVTVIYKKRDLGKVEAGENESPNFWYRYKTVNEEQTEVFGAVRDSWDGDGDTITYSIDTSFGDGSLFNIDTETGALTWKVAPDYENPTSQNASGVTDFSAVDGWQMRNYNQYLVKVLGNDGSGEANAVTENRLYFDVRNIPEETFDGNRVPFFRDMWGEETQFIDDAVDQSIKIKGFDLDFDALTWKILGVYASGDENSKGWGSLWGNYFGRPVSDAPLQVDSSGYLTPKSTLNYEDGFTRYEVMFEITDGKSTPITKQYHFTLKDSIADGTFEVIGHAHVSGYLSGATVWQDIDNDGIQDADEPFAVTNAKGKFKLSLSKAAQDSPILLKGGLDMGTGLINDKVMKINSDLAFSADREWGEYSLTPLSHVTLALQNLDRSIDDKTAVIDITKAMGFENGWVEGEGNYHDNPFYTLNSSWLANYPGDWDVHKVNLFIATNLVNIIGDIAANGAVTITQKALEDIIAKVTATTGAGSISSVALTADQVSKISQVAYNAAMEAIAEIVSGQTAYDGFRLSKINPVKITDHEISSDGVVTEVIHTPGMSVLNGVITMDSGIIEINRATLQDALNLVSGSKGLVVEVSVGSLPTTAETIQFTGKLIDGTDSTIDSGERSIEVRFEVKVDPSQEVGSSGYISVSGDEDITVIYTGEDGSVTETTIAQDGAMVTIEVPATGGAPVLKVDVLKVFEKGMSKTDLATYFSNSEGTNGQYYSELTFEGSSLQTADGDVFTKVIAPFSVAEDPTPVAYISDVTINENRGWAQLEVTLSKAAESDFVINYKFEGGDAIKDEDYWWWSDQDGYRQITFLKGQKNAVINVDVRNDNEAESTETFNILFSLDSETAGNAKLGNDQITVTIIDDDSEGGATALDTTVLTNKVISKVAAALTEELKTLTDANSGTLDSTSTTYSNILLSNSDITDISTYLTAAITAESEVFDSIIASTMDLATLWTSYLRGPTQTNLGNGIDAPAMAEDIAALAIGIDNIDLAAFTSSPSLSIKRSGSSDSSFNIIFSVTSVADGELGLQFSFGGTGWVLDNTNFKQEWYDNGFDPLIYSNIITDILNKTGFTSYSDASSYWSAQSSLSPMTGNEAIFTIGNNVFSNSGFKFNGPANIIDNKVVADKTVSTSSSYDNLLLPGQSGMVNTNWENINTASVGTVGDDTVTLSYVEGQGRDLFYSGGAGNDTITVATNTKGFIHGGAGNDILKSLGVEYHRFEGGPGDDILSASNFKNVLYKGDSGNDTFVIEAGSSFWNTNTQTPQGYDRDGDGEVSFYEYYDRPAVIIDFVSGQDKIGLKGDWANKTIVVVQGTGDFSNDVYLYDSQKDSNGNYYKLWGIVANTNAAGITSSDFVTLDANYASTAVSLSLSAFNFDSAIETSPGTIVGSVASSVNIVTQSEAGITFAITGGVDKDLFDIDSTSGLLSFKTSASIENALDFDRNGSYLVEVTASSGSDSKSGSMSITVTDDKTAPTLSNLTINTSVVEGVPVISISGLASDADSEIQSINFRLKNVETGSDKYFYANSNEISDDGTFTTQSATFGKEDPEGVWYITNMEVRDTSNNMYQNEVRGHMTSGVIKTTVVNPLYLGAFDTSVANVDSISLSYTVDADTNITTLTVSGTSSDDSSGVLRVEVQLKHNDTGATKWFSAYQSNGDIKEDGSFSKSNDLSASDSSGDWYVHLVKIKDFAGNETSKYNQGITTALASANVPNALSASATDKLAPVFSDVTLSSSVNSEGKTVLKATIAASDNESGISEVQVLWKHAKSEQNIFENHNFSSSNDNELRYIDSDGNYVIAHEMASNDPSGLYYLARITLKDTAGREWSKDVEGHSSWKTISVDNAAYTGSSSGDPSGSGDSTAPVLSDLVLTSQVSGSNTQLVLTGKITEAGSFNYGYLHYGIKGESVNLGNFWIGSNDIGDDGTFSVTRDLGTNAKPGTYILKDYTVRDSAQNRTSETLRQTESSIAGQEVTVINSSYVEDSSAPTVSDITMSTIVSGSQSSIKITGKLTETDYNYGYFHIRNKDVPTFNEQSIYLGDNNVNADGTFSITREVESNYPPGTYYISRYYLYDGSNNRTQEDIDGGSSAGKPLFDVSTVVENSSYVEDFVAPSVANIVLSSVNNLDGSISLKITGKVTDADFNYGYFNIKVKGGSYQQNINLSNDAVNDDGTFVIKQNLTDGAPTGTYYITEYYMYDNSSGYFKERVENSTDSAFFDTTVNISADPTSISFTASNLDEQTLGVSLGKISVNGDSSNSSIYTLVIGGKDASLLEISSLGYLRLKSDVKLDASYKSTLEFTLQATGTSGVSKTETYSVSVNETTSIANDITLSASTAVSGFAAGVNENAAGATVGTLARSDGSTKTYSVVTGTDYFEISGTTLKLKDSVSFNKEVTGTYLVSVQDSDGNKVHFDVSVVNVNETPTTISLSSAYMTEGVAGITVGTIVPGDPDVGDSHTYVLSGTDAGSFEIVSGSLKLKDSVTATYSTKSSYSVTIKATDAAGLNSTNNVTVNVLAKYSASIASKPGTLVTTLPAEGYSTNVSGTTFTYSIVGGDDSGLFEINSSTGALSFKSAKAIATPEDASMDNIYDVEILMVSNTGSSQIAKIGVTVQNDSVAPTVSDLTINYAVDSDDSKTTITITGKVKDDSSDVESVNISLKEAFTGDQINLYIDSNKINDDGSFSTSHVMGTQDPNGTWYVYSQSARDAAGNNLQIQNTGLASATVSKTIPNAEYTAGASDKSAPVITDLKLTYTTDGGSTDPTYLVVSGKVTDASDISSLNINVRNSFDGSSKSININSSVIESDGTFSVSGEMGAADTNGTWYIYQHRAYDVYGNSITYDTKGVSSIDSDMVATDVPNSKYLGSTDIVAPVFSNLAMSSKVSEVTGKTTVFVSGQIEDASGLRGNDFNVEIKHAKSGITKYLGGNENSIDENGLFTLSRELESSDPNGTWYIYSYSARDVASNYQSNQISGLSSATDSLSMTNSSYSGGDGGDIGSGIDTLAPELSNAALTIVEIDNKQYLKFSVNVANDTEATTWNYGQINVSNNDVPTQSEFGFSFNDNSSYSETANDGTFTGFYNLTDNNKAPGTYIITYVNAQDDTGNSMQIRTEEVDVSIYGDAGTATYTNSSFVTDTTAPALSNATLTVVEIDSKKYLKVSVDVANDPEASTWNYGQVSVKNTDVPSQNSFGISFNDNNSFSETANDGTFTGFYNLTDSSKAPGTYIITYVSAQDDTGNKMEINANNVGVSIYGDAGTATYTNSSFVTDTTAPALSNATLTVVEIDSKKYLKFSADVANDPEASTWNYGQVSVKNTDVPSQNSFGFSFNDNSSYSETANDGTFTGFYNLTDSSKAPGTYIITYVSAQDDTGNKMEIRADNVGVSIYGDAGTATVANSPTSITLSSSSVNEETLGITVGKIQVNGSDAGSLYSFTIGGDDASLLEVSSLGYLKLKATSKLDYETDAQLNFTLTATNEVSVAKTTSFSLAVNNDGAVSTSINLIGIEGILLDPAESGIQLNPDNGSEITISSIVKDENDALSELGIVIDAREDYEVAGSESESSELEDFLMETKNDEQSAEVNQTDQLLVSGENDLEDELLFINEIV